MKYLKDVSLKEKRVLVRVDFNVPLSEEGRLVVDDFRIKQTIPTIKHLIKEKAKIILISHLGRPVNRELKYSLRSVAKRLEEILRRKIFFTNDCLGQKIEKEVNKLKAGEIILLENLRFYQEEEKNEIGFAQGLAQLGDFYVNDAFGACHRAHASIVGIPKFLPAIVGSLLEKEIKILTNLIKSPLRPLVSLVGGAKVETKVGVINKLLAVSDFVLVSGLIKKEILEKGIFFENHNQKIVFPQDSIGENQDIGPLTIRLFQEKIMSAKTIFWNGPFGQIETEEFAEGTKKIVQAIIKSKAFSVVGGGETVEYVNRLGLGKKFNHLSTGGGAMLEFLAGERLPGIEILK